MKYKRCHLDPDRAGSSNDSDDLTAHRDLITEYLETARGRIRRFARRAMAPADDLRDGILARIGGGLSGRDAAFALRDYIAQLDKAMEPLLQGHSRLFWIQLARRWPSDPIGDSSSWTVVLYRRIFHLAVLKYGAAAREGEMLEVAQKDGASVIMPADISEEDIVALGAVEYLAYELNHAASAFRRIGKGAELRVVNGDLRALAHDEPQELMRRLDLRMSKYATLAGPFGAAVDGSLPIDRPDEAPLMALDLVVNVNDRPGEALAGFADLRFERPPNFVPHPVTLDEARETLVRFDADMTAAIGVSPDALLATIHGLSVHTLKAMRADPRVAAQLFTTGYIGMSWGEHYDGLCKNIGDRVQYWWKSQRDEEIGHDEATGIAHDALSALTYTTTDIENIDLWGRTPLRLVMADDRRALLDFEAIAEVLAGLFARVGFIPGDPGGVKGTAFEREVNSLAAYHGFASWRTGIVRTSGGKSREVDASFVVGSTLFLVECKAFSQNPKIELGDWAAIQNRWSTLKDDYLEQARTLRDFVETNRGDVRLAVPAEITQFEYAVCTPGVEWIPSCDPELWLNESVPRICTPAELFEVMASVAL